jgi:hypothetical protein
MARHIAPFPGKARGTYRWCDPCITQTNREKPNQDKK